MSSGVFIPESTVTSRQPRYTHQKKLNACHDPRPRGHHILPLVNNLSPCNKFRIKKFVCRTRVPGTCADPARPPPPRLYHQCSTSDDATGVKKKKTPRAAKMWCRRVIVCLPTCPTTCGTDWFCVRSTEVRVHDSA